jgi:endonuclease III
MFKSVTGVGPKTAKLIVLTLTGKLVTGTTELSSYGGSEGAVVSALDLINVVPNPYYAYSEYERNKVDTRVKITNLPTKCTVSIYTISGKLVERFEKDTEITFLDWKLTNSIGIPVASGIYLIHVSVPGVGERVIKSFIGMRQLDVQGF